MVRKHRTLIPLASLLLLLAAAPAYAGAKEAQESVDKATKTIEEFASQPNMTTFRDYASRAKGMLIVPTMVKAGFIFGGSAGGGVLLARGEDAEAGWSDPAFYAMGSFTFGLQIGGEVSQIILLVMTDKGLDSFLSTSAKLGGDVSIAAGPVGGGAKAQIFDILAFALSKGLYGGINLEGAVVDVQGDWNRDYYGPEATPKGILIERKFKNDGTAALRAAVAKAAHLAPAKSE